MFVGYSKVLNLMGGHQPLNSREINRLEKIHKDWMKDTSTSLNVNENDVIDLPTGNKISENNDSREIRKGDKIITNRKLFCEMRKLDSWFNPLTRQTINNLNQSQIFLLGRYIFFFLHLFQ
jgi:hypothetical protein